MAIFNDTFSVYERLASAKMRSLIAQINGHTHDGAYGVNIQFSDLNGLIDVSQLPVSPWIAGAMITTGAITNDSITSGSIGLSRLNLTEIHIDASTGYAVYAP